MAFDHDKIMKDIANMNSVKEVYRYLRMNAPDLVADWKSFEEYLFKAGVDKSKAVLPQIMRISNVKLHLEKNRPRDGSQLDPYEVYLQEKGNSSYPLRKDVFMFLFAFTCDILLDKSELHCNQSCLNAVSIWTRMGETREHIYEYISAMQTRPASAAYLYTLYISPDEDEADRRKSFGDATRALRKGMMCIEDAVCAVSLDEEDNDVLLENCSVYYEFTSRLLNRTPKATALVITPTPFFVRKWCADDALEGVNVTFAMGSEKVCDILSSRWATNKDFKFIPLEKLKTHLIKHGAPSDTLLFANHMGGDTTDTEEYLKALFQSANRTHSLSVFGGDGVVLRSVETQNTLLQVKKVTLYPAGIISATFPQRKELARFEYGYLNSQSREVRVRYYSLRNRADSQFLSRKEAVLVANNGVKVTSLKKLRKGYSSGWEAYVKKSDEHRRQAMEYSYSPEITIYYNASWGKGDQNTDMPRIEAYLYPPLGKAENAMRENRIPESVLRTRKIALDKVEEWLEEEYFFAPRKKGKNAGTTIRDAISDEYQKAYEGKPITLKTLLLIHPEVEELSSKVGAERLKEIAKGELGEAKTNQMGQQAVLAELYQMYPPETKGVELLQALNALTKLLDVAVKNKNCTENAINGALKKWRWNNSRINSVRRNLQKRVFTRQELRALAKMIDRDRKERIREAIGTALRLRMGLEPNIVCAFQWQDFIKVRDNISGEDVYLLAVRRQVSNDGKTYLPFNKAIAYRILPCTHEVAEMLLEEKECQITEKNLPEEDMAFHSMIQGSGMVKEDTTGRLVLPPKSLGRYGKMLLKQLGLPDDIVILPDDAKGEIESNLTYYGGDIFVTNHRHFCMGICGMDDGEYAFWRGNNGSSPFKKNYCDYENAASQHILRVKLERMEAIIAGDGDKRCTSKELDIRRVQDFESDTAAYRTACTDVDMKIMLDKEMSVTLQVENEYGFDIKISKIKEG